MIPIRCVLVATALLAAASARVGAENRAQAAPKDSPMMEGISKNRDQPVKIQATTLVVRDKDKVATFTGDVHVVQGDTDMRCKSLVVYYEGDPAKGGGGGDGSPGQGAGSQQIRRMIATGDVTVVQREQTAQGDRADYDMRSNTVILTGNVVVTKGQDVLRGQKLVVNMASGVSRMESGGGRVEGLFQAKGGAGQMSLPRPGQSR
jgi:lipopolysaccharide export system protein LptA